MQQYGDGLPFVASASEDIHLMSEAGLVIQIFKLAAFHVPYIMRRFCLRMELQKSD